MADTTLISWAHSSWNPWIGCTKCSDECIHCYIDADIRKETDWQSPVRGFRKPWGQIYLSKTNWTLPFRMQDKLDRENANHNPKVYKRVFSCSISDFFHPLVDGLNLSPWLDEMSGHRRIMKCACVQHVRQLLLGARPSNQ
jgi:protein gp37